MDIEQLTTRMNSVDLSGYSFTPKMGEKAICWHLFDMDLSPVNIMSRVNWYSQSIRITDGKTLCFLNLKHIKNFHFRTSIQAVWDFLQSTDSCAILLGSAMKIEYIRRFFTESGVFRSETEIDDIQNPQSMFPITPDMPQELHSLNPGHFIVLPICEMDGNIHIALLNRDFAYSKYLAIAPGPVFNSTITLDMAHGVRTHLSISGKPFGSSLNFFAAAMDYYKRNPCLIFLDLRNTSFPVPLSQFLMSASPYFPELQIIWVSHSISLTPGVDSLLFRTSAHLDYQANKTGHGNHHTSTLTVGTDKSQLIVHHNDASNLDFRNGSGVPIYRTPHGTARQYNTLKNKAPSRLERRQTQYETLFKKYNVREGSAPHVSNFSQMIFSLRSHRVNDKPVTSAGMHSFLDKKLEQLGLD